MKRAEIINTDDGTATLRHPVFGDTYHSLRGAAGESSHIFIDNGLAAIDKPHIRILEVGFGTGLNAWLSLLFGNDNDKTIDYRTIELYPISSETAKELHYTDSPVFMELHTAPWDKTTAVTNTFTITKYNSDLCGDERPWLEHNYDIIYFDAFAPDTQPELWTPELFKELFDTLLPSGILVTYSSKGTVKQALRDAGFTVQRLEGALGKRHMLRAVKSTR